YADVAYFVKGNDYFIIGLVSGADDLGDSASTQTKLQYDSAPPYTIPPSQWPESARSILAGPLNLATAAAYVLGGVVVLGLLALPADGPPEPFGKSALRFPTQSRDSGDVEGVAVVVAGPVGDELDQGAGLAHDVEHRLRNLQPACLGARADVVNAPRRCLVQ